MSTQTRSMLLNVGPSHPAMHGVIRLIMELDGEKIKGVDVEIGYLHRAFEKMCETVTYTQCFPYTDRLNYVSPLINNVGFAMAVEKLLGIDIPERAKYIRVIMSEISRVTDHLTCIGASSMELGAMSVFLYLIKAREFLYELVEEITGARLTISYVRIGGVKADLTPGFTDRAFQKIAEVRKVLIEADKLLTRNRIFFDRMKNTGKISAEDVISHGITGPFLRGSGIAYDVRKANPYLIYDRLDFEVPTGTTGDNLDRYFVRMAEMEQSLRIIEQCFQQIPDGPIAGELTGEMLPAAEMVDRAKMGQTEGLLTDEVDLDPTLQGSTKKYYKGISADKKDVVLPPKEETYGNIEGLMNHFKLVMYGHGIRPPVGEVYFPVEGANGELGFYIVSDGRDQPWRVRVHPPCFPIMSALPKCLIGDQMADLVPTFGSVNMIAGELDR
ncbi:MAG: NADH-quinone oxidoreductase subunit D [Candidatus Omnitrophica bacterium]|nr:NADH-quinone oxidoreductase subunit D [Candidatus Omnitrophota bacterium]